jgi:hypothetical protein
MSSIVELAAKFTEDLSQLNQKNDAQKNEIQHIKAKLGEILKKKWKNKQSNAWAIHTEYR